MTLPNVTPASEYNLELDLFKEIVPSESTFTILSSKIEFNLKKKDVGVRWDNLEGPPPNSTAGATAGTTTASSTVVQSLADVPSTQQQPLKYPTSSKKPHDWDKLATNIAEEEKSETLEGDAALNQLFQKIYSGGSDEVRKAMNKSFQESGGTVLSTNWSEVGKEKIQMQAPEGVVPKKWEA